MSTQTRTTVKSWFERGDRPTQTQFGDWIDSSLFLADTGQQEVQSNLVLGTVTVSALNVSDATVSGLSVTNASFTGTTSFTGAVVASAGVFAGVTISAGAATGIGFSLGITGASSRSAARKMSDHYSVRDFGAVGNGTINDTAAIRAAVAAAELTAAAIYVPAGRYRMEGIVSVSGVGHIYGDGIGLTQLIWSASASSAGFHCTGHKNYDYHHFHDMTFITGQSSAQNTAILLDYTPEIVVSGSTAGQTRTTFDRDSPRSTIERMFFSGGSAQHYRSGWYNGVDSIAALQVNTINCAFTGWIDGSVAGIGSVQSPGSNAAIRHRGVSTGYESGHPTQFLTKGVSIYAYTYGVSHERVEGAFLENVHAVGCTFGALFLGPTSGASPLPQFNVNNSHFNCYSQGVRVLNGSQAIITGTTFYNPPDVLTGTTGVYIGSTGTGFSRDSVVSECGFVMSNGTGTNCVVVEGSCQRIRIDNNSFEWGTVGVALLSAATSCLVTDTNTFQSGIIGTKYSDGGTRNVVAIETSAALRGGHTGNNNGILVRWGNQAVGVSAAGGTINFTQAFPNTAYTVVITNGDKDFAAGNTFAITTINSSGFIFAVTPATTALVRINYVAYGN